MKIKSLLMSLVSRFTSSPLASLSTLVVLTSSFVLIAGYWVLMINVQSALNSMGDDLQMTVYLKDDLRKENRAEIERLLSETKYFSKIEYVSKEKAVQNFANVLPNFAGDLTNSDFGNPLPSSYELNLLPDYISAENSSALAKLSKKLFSIQWVDDVSYGQSWLKNYSSLLRSSRISGYFLLFALIIGSLLVVSFSIKNALVQRREEIEIMELVGATPGQVRIPYVLEGALMGLVASVVSVILCYILYKTQSGLIYKEIEFLGIVKGIQFLSFSKMMMFIIMGVGIGAIGSYLSVSKINTGWAAAERANRVR